MLGWNSSLALRAHAALVRLAKATGLDVSLTDEPAPYLVSYQRRSGKHDRGGVLGRQRLYSQEQIAAFEDLVTEIESVLIDAYGQGRFDGSELLKRLSRGDITVFDFEEAQSKVRVIRAERAAVDER